MCGENLRSQWRYDISVFEIIFSSAVCPHELLNVISVIVAVTVILELWKVRCSVETVVAKSVFGSALSLLAAFLSNTRHTLGSPFLALSKLLQPRWAKITFFIQQMPFWRIQSNPESTAPATTTHTRASKTNPLITKSIHIELILNHVKKIVRGTC